jgi:hypothetical protein
VKEAKKEKDQQADKGISTVREALDRIKSNPTARAVLKGLVQAGFNETTIVQIVFSYCAGTQKAAKTGLDAARAFGLRLESCSRRLAEDADLVGRIMVEGERYGYRFHVEYQERWEWINEMKSFADWLSTAAKKVNAGLKNIRLGGQKKVDKDTKETTTSKLNIAAGREQYLVYLAYFVSGGKKPTMRVYKLIAPLVAAVTDESDRVNLVIADGLRNDVTRFEAKYPAFSGALAAHARKESEDRRARLPQTLPRT